MHVTIREAATVVGEPNFSIIILAVQKRISEPTPPMLVAAPTGCHSILNFVEKVCFIIRIKVVRP